MKLSELLEQRARRGPHRRPAEVLAAARSVSSHDVMNPIKDGNDRMADHGLETYPTAGSEPPHAGRRFPAVLAIIALGCVAAIAAAFSMRDPSALPPAASVEARFRFETPNVLLSADAVEVIDNGHVFKPAGDVDVQGDPGWSEYTTLEITWSESGREQRIYVYFASDGISWWASEIRAYNGNWIEPIANGEFFRSPLGVAHKGDLTLPNLRIRGMQIEAFRRPASCDAASGPLVLIADYPAITSWPGGFAASLQLVDTQTCAAVPVAPYTFEYVSENADVAAIDASSRFPDSRPTKTRLELRLVAPGATTIRATAKDRTGNIVGTAEMKVVVRHP